MDLRAEGHDHQFAFRRRCGWCGVQLRRWQLQLCRRCNAGATAPGPGSAPCGQAARWNDAPDVWPWGRRP